MNYLNDPRLDADDRYDVELAIADGRRYGHEELIGWLATEAFAEAIPFFVYEAGLRAAQYGWAVPTRSVIEEQLRRLPAQSVNVPHTDERFAELKAALTAIFTSGVDAPDEAEAHSVLEWDGSGQLTEEELQEFLRELGIGLGETGRA